MFSDSLLKTPLNTVSFINRPTLKCALADSLYLPLMLMTASPVQVYHLHYLYLLQTWNHHLFVKFLLLYSLPNLMIIIWTCYLPCTMQTSRHYLTSSQKKYKSWSIRLLFLIYRLWICMNMHLDGTIWTTSLTHLSFWFIRSYLSLMMRIVIWPMMMMIE